MEGAGGGLFPLNEARRHWKQHPPIVAGLEMGGNGMGTGCGQAGGGGRRGGLAARQAARARERAAKCCGGRGGLSK